MPTGPPGPLILEIYYWVKRSVIVLINPHSSAELNIKRVKWRVWNFGGLKKKNERKKKKRKTLNKLRIHVSRIFKEFETNEKNGWSWKKSLNFGLDVTMTMFAIFNRRRILSLHRLSFYRLFIRKNEGQIHGLFLFINVLYWSC